MADETMVEDTKRWFAGIDWGSAKHLYPGGRDQCLCKLTVRADLLGATIRALVPRAPNVDLCPGRLATTDAQ